MLFKRAFDIIGSIVALLVLAPALLMIGVLIKLTSPGPVFYRARRVSRNGTPFRMYKFRTMIVGADKAGPGLTYKDDPRITRIGRLLRKVRLDELPQFLNVLQGDMSLVGPRPEAVEYVDLANPLWRKVLLVRPGICGLAQLTFAFDETEILNNVATVGDDYVNRVLPTKLAIDAAYIERRSMLLDITILWRTALALVWQNSAAQLVADVLPQQRSQLTLPPSTSTVRAQRSVTPSMIRQIMPLITLDALSVVASFWFAMEFRFDGAVPAVDLQWLVLSLPIVVATYLVMNSIFGLYRYLWRYASADAVLAINAAAASSTLLLFGWTMLWRAERPIPLSVVVVGGIFSAALFTVVRYRQRLLTGLMGRISQITGRPDRQRVLVIGAGDAGQMLARQIQSWGSERAYELVGFVDDNPAKHGQRIHDVEVLGARASIPQIVAERDVGLVIIAIHKLEGAILRDMLSLCLATSARVKILPDFLGSIDQAHNVLPLRDIQAEDLLGRELTEVDEQACSAMIAGSTILVTGGAGSIGSELCRQIMALRPRLLLMVDNNETGLHDLFISLQCPDGTQVVPIVADVTNYARMEALIARYRPKALFHAAAYKHVPMMEHHPSEAVRVNILGTLNLSDLAAQYGVERFVFVSTDKAVNPSSVMGATKRVGELLIMANAERTRTSVGRSMFTAVRFGNVLGSRGSVVPTFVKQIERGGPVTITHPEMTRFFISISEAVSLVIQAATMTDGGDIFMLDMGQPIRIEDLAHKMIRLRGLRPHADIPIMYTGVRPGEKLCEELTSSDELRLATIHPKLFQIHSSSMADSAWLYERITELVNLALDQQTEQLTELLWQLVRADTAPWPLDVREVGEPLHSHMVGETLAYSEVQNS